MIFHSQKIVLESLKGYSQRWPESRTVESSSVWKKTWGHVHQQGGTKERQTGLPATLFSTLELAKLSETVNLALVKIPKSQGGDLTLAGTLVPLFRKTSNNNNNGRRQDVTHTESQDLGSRAVQVQVPETNTRDKYRKCSLRLLSS